MNLLTAERVKQAAAEEIKTGRRVQLDWSMDNVQFPGFRRKKFEQTVISKANPATGWIGCDDEVSCPIALTVHNCNYLDYIP